MPETKTKDVEVKQPENRGTAPVGPDTTYVGPDLSFTEGHGDPPDFGEVEVEGVVRTTEGWVVEPKSREENIEARNEEVDAATEADEEIGKRRAEEAEEEAERSAEQAEETRKLQTAVAGLVTTASRPRGGSKPAEKKSESS